MKYILKDGFRKQSCVEHINKLDLRYPWAVEITRYRPNRSRSQNNTMWLWYSVIADHVGMDPKDLHEEMKARVLGLEEKTMPRFFLGVDYGQTRTIITPRSTTGLTVEEMTNFLTAIQTLAASLNVKLPMPDDYKMAMGLEEADARGPARDL